jgi:hypothetical protein
VHRPHLAPPRHEQAGGRAAARARAADLSLQTLELFDNAIRGTIPAQYAALTALTRIDAHSNKLAGGLPASLAGLTRLAYLDPCSVMS